MNSILKKAESGEAISYEEAIELQASKDFEELFQVARGIANENHGKKITFYKNAFPPVSVTGTKCSLNCKHCGRHYLEHMIPAPNEEKLIEVCRNLNDSGALGIVLSGGSRRDGVIPLDEFVNAIREVKVETNLVILAHTGPINDRQAEILGKAGLDGALIDVVGSAKTTERVYGIRITPERYSQALKAIEKSEIHNISPHLIVGLDFGEIVGEVKALELLSDVHLDTIVVVVLIPTRGTKMQRVAPPSPIEIGKIVSIAQLMYPEVPISLGCVRPGKNYRVAIDEFAILAGARKLAVPTPYAQGVAKELGLKIKEFGQMCCAWM